MKTWLIAIPFLLVANLVIADEKPQQSAQPEPAMAPAKPHHKLHRHTVRRLPRGDLRYCLELKDNEFIIRCAETGRKD